MTSLSDYYDMLQKHDWTYAMSDDHRVYKRGQQAESNLQRIAQESTEHKKLYEAYSNFGWGKGPRPERPMEKAFRTGENDAS